ncbi:Small subunit processome component [Coelomomyces lativittatus]|nr:Small subunit processome component [Coelomomyces lativittatus]KAJ1511616.1 Small subunit processome component [Coelomomyces lativittatus]KAJ1517587.1 Small subunit processome component [Coelomomyces lativittatus]
MQLKRIKAHKSIMRVYTSQFGFFPPLHVIVDGSFLHEALQHRLNLSELFTKHFGYPVTLFTTTCILESLRQLGTDALGTLLAAQRYTHRRCTHPFSSKCLTMYHPYCVLATNDPEVHTWVHQQVGIPCVSLRQGGVLVIHKPTSMTPLPLAAPPSVTTSTSSVGSETLPTKKRKSKSKLPNPLSVKKKKQKPSPLPLTLNKTNDPTSLRQKRGKKRKRCRKRTKHRVCEENTNPTSSKSTLKASTNGQEE